MSRGRCWRKRFNNDSNSNPRCPEWETQSSSDLRRMHSILTIRVRVRLQSPPTVFLGLLLLSTLAWLAGGCVSSSRSSSAPKPGKGIAEYREVVRDAHRSVAAVVDLLEALSRSITPSSAPTPQGLARFDRAFHELELTSIKARAKAEAIIARGQTYFDEWKGNLSGITNRATALAETERYERVSEHFEP